MQNNNTCERCLREARSKMMSRFNTQMICMTCIDKEQNHPMYKEAYDAELKQVRAGNMNFEGIGLPEDLK